MKRIILSTILTLSTIFGVAAQNSQFSDLGQKQITLISNQAAEKEAFMILKSELENFSMSNPSLKECVEFRANYRMLVDSNDELLRDAGKQLKIAGQFMAWGAAATAVGSLLSAFGEPVSGSLVGLGGIILTYSGYGKIEKAGRILNSAGK
jgi:hypothetical protein